MFVMIGTLVVFGSIVLGYTMHGGQLMILFQVTEFIIIGGAALGSLLISNPLEVSIRVFKGTLSTLSGAKFTKNAYLELLRCVYELLQLARKDGTVSLEKHFEEPTKSDIFKKAPSLLKNHHAVHFLCDTLRTVVNGNVAAHDLEDLMDRDLELQHEYELQAPAALNTLSDSLPGLGIVAAVLGVVITMGKIDKPPAVIGHSVAAALVGTFIGILLCYGLVGPLSRNLESRIHSEGRYMHCIKAAILSFAKGLAPGVVIESARRAIAPDVRPSFEATEKSLKKA